MSSRHRQRLRVMQSFHSVFYTPIYVAIAGGFLESEGLDVTFSGCPPEFPHTLSALNYGAADIVQSGIMRCIIAADWGAETVPAHIAQINARDGFFVLGRRPQEEFRWQDMRGAKVIPVGFSPAPWASLQYALGNHGVAPSELNLIPGLSSDQAVRAFRRGEADFIHLPQPAAEQLISEGEADLAVALGPVNGHIAFSSFAATNQFLAAKPQVAQSFVRGFARALQWLAANDSAAAVDAVAYYFPNLSQEVIIKAIERYKAQDTWPTDPLLGQAEYEKMQDILVVVGLVKERQPYDKVVRTEFAQGALE